MNFSENLKNTFRNYGDGCVRSICFSPNQNILCSSGIDSRTILWDLANLKKWKEFGGDIRHHTTGIWCVDYSPSGKLIGTASSDTDVRLWEVDKEENVAILKDHTDYVRTVRFTYDGKSIISGGDDETIKIWNIEKQKSSHTFKMESSSGTRLSQWIRSVDVTPDSNILCSGTGFFSGHTLDVCGCVMIWDQRSKVVVHSFKGSPYFEGVVYQAKIHQDSHCIASGSGDHMVNVFDIRMFKLVHKFENHSEAVKCVSFHPIEGKYLISGGSFKKKDTNIYHGEIFTYDLKSSSVVQSIKYESPVNDVTFSPKGDYFASGHGNGKVLLWESNFLVGRYDEDEKERIHFLNEHYFCDGGGDNNIENLKVCIVRFDDNFCSTMYISKLLF